MGPPVALRQSMTLRPAWLRLAERSAGLALQPTGGHHEPSRRHSAWAGHGTNPHGCETDAGANVRRGAEKSASGVDVAYRHRQELASNLQSNQRPAEIFGR